VRESTGERINTSQSAVSKEFTIDRVKSRQKDIFAKLCVDTAYNVGM